ncbi:MAG: hypothetical protein Q7S45_05235 [Candidatus Curtissbacteria bacterium]|nr:hypothetical protein [Candidatus Curtissbacteria bacterium]
MSFLKLLWKKWLKVAHVIGNFQAQVILTIFYFVIAAPFGLVSRYFGDSLNMKPRRMRSNFNKWDHPKDDLQSAHRQY